MVARGHVHGSKGYVHDILLSILARGSSLVTGI